MTKLTAVRRAAGLMGALFDGYGSVMGGAL